MTEFALFALLFAAMASLYIAVDSGNKRLAEVASMVLIGAVLVAFLVWFVLCGPRPEYIQEHSTIITPPIEMRD